MSLAPQELYRLASHYVFIQIKVPDDGESGPLRTVANRERWEQWCWEAGCRKHPMYYNINDYADLNDGYFAFKFRIENVAL